MADHGGSAPRSAAHGALRRLAGTWDVAGSHPMLPGAELRGVVTFTWIEDGAFLLMRSDISDPRIPAGVAVIGADDTTGGYSMLYADVRGVSRLYEMTLDERAWTWSRSEPSFSQRFTGTFADNGNTIISAGELSRDGAPWEGDLALTYTRRPE